MQKHQYIGTNPMLWLVVAIIAIIAVGNFRAARADDIASRYSYVNTTCIAAQASGDFSSCYAAESSANAEYLCNSSGSCWVEVK